MQSICLKDFPAILAGMLLLVPSSLPASDALMLSLFEDGNWSACQREYRRLALSEPLPPLPAQLANAVSITRSGGDSEMAIAELTRISAQSERPEIAASAAYERARILWGSDQPDAALASCLQAFLNTRDRQLFLHAACTAFLIMEKHRHLKAERECFMHQINSTRDLWSGALIASCRLPAPDRPCHAARPASWLVAFYRTQISPAIGARCTLEPSCSEYFLEASHKHTLTAYAMLADRLCREPSVSQMKEDPILVNGQVRYRDPVHDHDFWRQP